MFSKEQSWGKRIVLSASLKKKKSICTKNLNYVLIFVKVDKTAVDTACTSKPSVANSNDNVSELLSFPALVSPVQVLQVSQPPHGQHLSPVFGENWGCSRISGAEGTVEEPLGLRKRNETLSLFRNCLLWRWGVLEDLKKKGKLYVLVV